MPTSVKTISSELIRQPAALLLAEIVTPIEVEGEFNQLTSTWSDREFACASEKKHNEAM